MAPSAARAPPAAGSARRSLLVVISLVLVICETFWIITTITGCSNFASLVGESLSFEEPKKERHRIERFTNMLEEEKDPVTNELDLATGKLLQSGVFSATNNTRQQPAPSFQVVLDKDYSNVPHARVFNSWNFSAYPFPCAPGEKDWMLPRVQRSPSRTGILFVRNMKTGSSTAGGISIRIARNVAKRNKKTHTKQCKVHFDHTPARSLQYGQRDKTKSWLFSFVRDPTKRAMSEFWHFGVSRRKLEPTTANFKQYIFTHGHHNNYFLFDMTLRNFNGTRATWKEKEEHVAEIMREYNFIGLTERMDESLVVMKMLLKLKSNDILYLSAKGGGGYDDGAYGQRCVYIVPTYKTYPPEMQELLASDKWRNMIDGDSLLYQAASASLDLTINALGRKRVERQVAEFQRLKELANTQCLPKTRFPCRPDGSFHRLDHDCLWWDSGCGYMCLDSLQSHEQDEKKEIDGLMNS